MSPILLVLVVAVLIGLVTRGSFRNFERLHVHWWGLALGGVALQLLPVPTSGALIISLGRGGSGALLDASTALPGIGDAGPTP